MTKPQQVFVGTGVEVIALRQCRSSRPAGRQAGRKAGHTPRYIFQRSAAVCTGASHSASCAASTAVTVIEQPAISSEVT